MRECSYPGCGDQAVVTVQEHGLDAEPRPMCFGHAQAMAVAAVPGRFHGDGSPVTIAPLARPSDSAQSGGTLGHGTVNDD